MPELYKYLAGLRLAFWRSISSNELSVIFHALVRRVKQ
jgi:hypothetical protein